MEKNYLPDNTSVSQNPYDLILMGDFQIEGDSILLDYANYRHYWIPFNPKDPFYNLNWGDLKEYTEPGYIRSGEHVDPEAAIKAGDFVYGCFCNVSTTIPNDCKTLWVKGRGRCVLDSRGSCDQGCMGNARSIYGNFGGGGIIVKVSSQKTRLIHNFNTSPYHE